MTTTRRNAYLFFTTGVFGVTALIFALSVIGCGKKTAKPTGTTSKTSKAWTGALTIDDGDWDKLKAIIDSHSESKVVVVSFWATWKTLSVRELSELARLQKKHGDKVACIAVSVDFHPKEDETKKETKKEMRSRVQNALRMQFGKGVGKEKAITPTVVLFHITTDDEDFMDAADINTVPTVLIYMAGDRTLIEEDEFSFKKHVLPVIERLLKE